MRELSRIERGPGIDQQLTTDDWWDLRDALRGKISGNTITATVPFVSVFGFAPVEVQTP